MAKNKDRGHRESRKPQQELPELPDRIGRLSMPRKTNRSAAKYIATTGWFWDRRRVQRRDARRRIERQRDRAIDPHRRHLAKADRRQMLAAMPRWRYAQATKAFVATEHSAEVLEELIAAAVGLGDRPITLRVHDLSLREAWRIRERLADGSAVDPIDPEWPGPVFG